MRTLTAIGLNSGEQVCRINFGEFETRATGHRVRARRDKRIGVCLDMGCLTTMAFDAAKGVHDCGLRHAGARAVGFLSPALGMVMAPADSVFPILDATELHALAAVDWALDGQSEPSTPRCRHRTQRNTQTIER